MDDVENIKSKVDLVEVITSYVPLKKAGRNFAGLCPFHSEKTPSFMVSPERQAWKCFGCNESGDVFTFLEKIEGWEFREALEELAKRAGVKLSAFAPSAQSKTKEKLVAINSLVAKFYAHLLNNHKVGVLARKYLTGRGIRKETWEKFDLGYAPAGWENTLNFLKKRGFQLADVAATGLIIARGGKDQSYYDRFRNRLIFPIKDSRGTVLGFSARVIDETLLRQGFVGQSEPKYVNTPQTVIFDKGALLFGLDVSKEEIRKKNEVVLVEGEFDVLSSYQVGVNNVVASKGTALTEKQVATLARLCENVALCFDADVAGDAASRRGIELLDLAGMNVKVVGLGKFKDPDEFAKSDSSDFKKAIDNAQGVYDYFIDSASGRYDAKSVEGKKKIGKEIIPIFAKISDDLVRAYYIERLAQILELEVNLVAAAVEKKLGKFIEGKGEQFEQADGIASRLNKRVNQEEYFLALILAQDKVIGDLFEKIAPSDFQNEKASEFWKWLGDIMAVLRRGRASGISLEGIAALLKKLPSELNRFVDELYLVEVSVDFEEKDLWAQELIKVAERIKQASFKRKLAEISAKLREAEAREDTRKMAILTKSFDEVAKQLNRKGRTI